MTKQVIKLRSNLTDLLANTDPDKKNLCLFNGNGWSESMAWNPCDSYVLPAGDEMDTYKLEKFIRKHSDNGHLVAGYLNYELGYQIQGLALPEKAGPDVPYMVFFAYENYLRKENDEFYAYFEDEDFLDEIKRLDEYPAGESTIKLPAFTRRWSRKSFDDAFKKIKKYIYDGVIYQINLTQELEGEYEGNTRQLFAHLSGNNTAKMKAYIETDDCEILSLSPERFIATMGDAVETTPIKGTRQRGRNKKEDDENEADLLADEKEKAELNMITDLLRNDLGKVCSAGSVEVIKNRQLEKLTSVMHTSSLIRGKLKENISPIKALLSMFPGGSITGCPKKKSMEIIDELEQFTRGAYCGCMVMISPEGNLDSSIIIRTIIKTGKALSLSVGSGIVNDSVLEKEYQENLDKVDPLIGGLA